MKYIDADNTSTEIASPSGQVENLTFEEYLRGVFEINNGIENDPDNLVRIHAPELLKLARKQEQPEVDLEKDIDAFFDKWDKNSHGCLFDENGTRVTIETIKRVLKHFLNARKV